MAAQGTVGAPAGAVAGKAGSKEAPKTMDSAAVSRRLQQELMQLMMSGEKGLSAFPCGDNIMDWTGTIEGAEGTPYAGQKYKLELQFSAEYPFKPPNVRFATPCYHPNVDWASGTICLDILRDQSTGGQWSAAYSVKTVLVSIQSLLGDPNPASPLNAEAARLWDNVEDYTRVVAGKYARAADK
ncbi:unnamed protein product [Pedinophyceae sp. YPF-701]|nr:unnamed protein product [Pedinophyceae sp. YPF-701]